MVFIDDLEREIVFDKTPQRIISLVPSVTELLFDLGLDDNIAGCTDFCVHPKEKVRKIYKIGGTKDFSLNKIRELKPDLIISVKEENNRELVLEIANEFPTVIFEVVDIESALELIKSIGIIVNKKDKSARLIKDIKHELLQLKTDNNKVMTACYLIWENPMITVNSDTFISEMMSIVGFKNIFSDNLKNYPEITKKELLDAKPEYILLSSEPFFFSKKHQKEYQIKYPNFIVILVNGEMFSWYGSRMLKAFKYFKSLEKNLNSASIFISDY